MPLPRVRFTVRRLMIAVAAVGVIIGGLMAGWRHVEAERRRESYQRRAEFHSRIAIRMREAYEQRPHESVILMVHSSEFAATPALKLAWAGYHEKLSRKYATAVHRPWEPLSPDPPVPEIVPPYDEHW